MEELLSRACRCKPLRAIWHHTLALCRTHSLAQIRLTRRAKLALAAFGRVEQDHIVARAHVRHALTGGLDHTRAFMAQDGGKGALGVATRQGVYIRMAQARKGHAHTHFTFTRRCNVHIFYAQRLVRLPRNGGLASNRLSFRGHGRTTTNFSGPPHPMPRLSGPMLI